MPAVLASIVLLHSITQSLNNIILIIKDKPEVADMPEAPPTTIASASSISSSIIRLHCFHIRLIFLWRQKQMFLKKELLPKSLPWLPFWESSPFFVSYRSCVMVYPVCCLKKRIIWVGSEKCRRKAIPLTEKAVNNKSFLFPATAAVPADGLPKFQTPWPQPYSVRHDSLPLSQHNLLHVPSENVLLQQQFILIGTAIQRQSRRVS